MNVLRYETDPQVPAKITGDETIPPGMPDELSGHLQLRNLTFGYSHLDPPLIEDFPHPAPGSASP